MVYQNDDRRAAVMHIQQLLRTIEIARKEQVTVPIDGIYGSDTARAVSKFQKENGLPVTGSVDKGTYDLLYAKAIEADLAESDPLPIYLFERGRTVQLGEKSDFVLLLRGLLNALTVAYDSFAPLSLINEFNTEMENAVKAFQMQNSLRPTGVIDTATWNAIVRNYDKHIQQG